VHASLKEESSAVPKRIGHRAEANAKECEGRRPVSDEFALEFREVSKIFKGSRDDRDFAAVREVSISVARGEVLCLMGTSGSGKSTLLRHINRLVEPTSGEVLVNGRSLESLTTRELREMRSHHVGMVFQNFGLLPHRTIRDNVALPLELRGEPEVARHAEADHQLKTVGLGDWAEHYPCELSGGMQQRVGLARALVGGAQILLLDEPFSALDPSIRRDLQAHFSRIVRERKITAIVVTHDPNEALRLADRIAVIRAGKLIQIGTPDELVHSPVDAGVADFFRDNSTRDIQATPLEHASKIQGTSASTGGTAHARVGLLPRIILGPAALAEHGREGLFWLGMACQMAAVAALCGALRPMEWRTAVTAAILWTFVQLFSGWKSVHCVSKAKRAWVTPLMLLLVTQSLVAWRVFQGDAGAISHFPENRDAMLSVASFIDELIVWCQTTFEGAFVGVIFVVRSVIDGIEGTLGWLPWPLPALCLVAIAWRTAGKTLAVASVCALLYLGIFGFWARTIATLALVGSSVFLSLLIGIPVGILIAKRIPLRRLLSPLLGVMQTLPTFVYLIPAVAFFSVGKTPAVIATVIFAVPPMIRLTSLGIQEVPKSSVEAAMAHGATFWQILTKVELPLAAGSLLLGVNQVILMSLSMVVVAALIGADGLGYDVMTALRNVRGGEGMLAGFAIVFCALIPDRIIQSALRKRQKLFN